MPFYAVLDCWGTCSKQVLADSRGGVPICCNDPAVTIAVTIPKLAMLLWVVHDFVPVFGYVAH